MRMIDIIAKIQFHIQRRHASKSGSNSGNVSRPNDAKTWEIGWRKCWKITWHIANIMQKHTRENQRNPRIHNKRRSISPNLREKNVHTPVLNKNANEESAESRIMNKSGVTVVPTSRNANDYVRQNKKTKQLTNIGQDQINMRTQKQQKHKIALENPPVESTWACVIYLCVLCLYVVVVVCSF